MKLEQFARQRRETVPPDDVRRRLVVSVSEAIGQRSARSHSRLGAYAWTTGLAALAVIMIVLRASNIPDFGESPLVVSPTSSPYFASTIQLSDMTVIMLTPEVER